LITLAQENYFIPLIFSKMRGKVAELARCVLMHKKDLH